MNRRQLLQDMRDAMRAAFGPTPSRRFEDPFAGAVWAVAVQNADARAADAVLSALGAAGLLEIEALRRTPQARLEALLRPAGCQRVKAGRLRRFLDFVAGECGASLAPLGEMELDEARRALLSVKGIGPETADVILLFALNRPSFAADARLARICARHGLVPEGAPYDEFREFFMDALPGEPELFRECHAQLVRVGREFCRPRAAVCQPCPLSPFLE